MNVQPVFLTTWVIGIGVTAFIFWATSGQHWAVRAPLRALALAVTFTPSIAAGGHGAGFAPAIVVLLWGPCALGPRYSCSWAGPILFGALPIAIVWAVLLLIWAVLMHIWAAIQKRGD